MELMESITVRYLMLWVLSKPYTLKQALVSGMCKVYILNSIFWADYFCNKYIAISRAPTSAPRRMAVSTRDSATNASIVDTGGS